LYIKLEINQGLYYDAQSTNHQVIITVFLRTDAQLDSLKINIKFALKFIFKAFNCQFWCKFKFFLWLSNCASVGEKNFDNYQDARYVREKQ